MCACDTTIAAIATPPGNSGVGIVRISGPQAVQIAGKILSKPIPKPRYAAFTKVTLGAVQDDAVVIYFPAPFSFTGEDIVEIQCHGGALLLEKVLAAIIKNGAKMAAAGEFSRRALLNGKITLDRAEALATIIHAESDAELASASDFLSGAFAEQMAKVEQSLVEISASVEAALDHPEEVALPRDLAATVRGLVKTLSRFTDTAAASKFTYDGIRVAILGRPNVGKSSLFNALLGSSRSIVTEIPGTTTDTVSETVQIGGYKVRLIDTAGIRTSDNKIEQLGVARSRAAARECDIALIVGEMAPEILVLTAGKPQIVVAREDTSEKIKKQIIEKTVGALGRVQSRTIVNARQLEQLQRAKAALESALAAIKTDTVDCVASDIRTALYHVGNVTGTNATEAVLDEIFSRFCLGK